MTSNKPFPHIFSLISSSPEEDVSSNNNNNISSGYQTPQSSHSGSTTATPRSLFSTPPNSPPRPKSHVEERMKMRRYKLSMNQNGSENDDLLSNNMQHRGTDQDDDEEDYSSPDNSPNSSPRKNDLLSMSPLHQRLAQARTKREQILEERVKSIEIKSKHKEEMAMKNKEDVTKQLIEKARLELAKSPLAKERRDKQVAQRVKSVEATIESKNSLAKRRVQQHLYDKQQRASNVERKDRAERRRKLISYEKRAKLLASLNTKLERAALKSNKINEEKATKAAEDVDKAKAVARRVKAARTIQSLVRSAYDIKRSQDNTNSDAALSQHGAAERLQRWFDLRVHVSKRRLFGTQNGDEEDTADAMKALEILKLFSQGVEFEQISQIMIQPQTLKMAMVIVDCLRPINEVSFRSSTNNKSATMNGRTLLSLLLIAVHPREVLGDDFDKKSSSDKEEEDEEETKNVESRSTNRVSQLLALSSHSLLEAIKLLQSDKENTSATLKSISQLCLQASELFSCWKRLDMAELIENLTKQLEQSWFVYLTSSETLKYLVEVTGTATGDVDINKVDDPLASLRLRHEASRSGSRSHIKRIRISLNKLIDTEDGKEVVKTAKVRAKDIIEESEAMDELKDEINEIYGNVAPSTPELSGLTAEDETGTFQDIDQRFLGINLPDEILSNRLLVHKILLTDPVDFNSLSWTGTDAQQPNVSLEDFIMASLTPQEQVGNSATCTTQSMEHMPMRIAESMKLAFFSQMAQQMKEGNYGSVREMLRELYTKMRSLLPNREDLHSHLNDESAPLTSSTSDILRCCTRSAYLLSNYLESAARAPSTVELIDCLEAFLSRSFCDDNNGSMIPYEVESEELFAVISIAYLIHKTELCQVDISNYKLSQAAPLLHLIGNEYEVKHFKKSIGRDYSSTTSIEELKHIIPSTFNWIKKLRSSFGSSGENLTCHSNFDQKMDIVKGQGFVDGILFTRSQLILPEVLSLDVESISHIRSEARLCVIASALALHACSIAKVGTAIPSSEADDARQRLSSVLRKKHFDQDQLESEVIDAIGNLTKALAERDLNEDESSTLKHRALVVLNGDDPVLKLLDNRVRSFFRFACKWKPDNSCTTVPLEMKTGRSVLKEGDTTTAIPSTKAGFLLAAEKEVLRLGFAYFGSDLIKAGNKAQGIIALACKNYGRDILDRLLVADVE